MANKNQKYGRNKRANSNKTQTYRTARNKERRIKNDLEFKELKRAKGVQHGLARAKRRQSLYITKVTTSYNGSVTTP